MFKGLYIGYNLYLFGKVGTLLVDVKNMYGADQLICNNITIATIEEEIDSDYKRALESRKEWKHIFLDDMLLTALRDELLRLKKRRIDYMV